jgi:hypothetical protein
MAISASGTSRGGIWRDVAISNLTSSAAETTLFSTVIPGGALNLANKLIFQIAGRLSTPLLTPGTLTIRVKYGTSVAIVSTAPLALVGNASNVPYKINGYMVNTGSTSTQYMQSQLTCAAGGIAVGASVNLADAFPAMDSTIDQTFAVTAQFSVSSANNILTTPYFEVSVNS